MRFPLEMKLRQRGGAAQPVQACLRSEDRQALGPSREAAGEPVLTLLRVCEIRKSCKLDLPAVTRRNRLSQGGKTAGDADGNQKLTGNKPRANRKERVPFPSSRRLVSLVPPTGRVQHSRWAKRKWFSESQPQIHKAQKRGMDLKPRENK